MAFPVPDTYSAPSGQAVYGGRFAPETLPAWRQGMAQWQWKELPGTAAYSGKQPDVIDGLLGSGSLSGRLNAWNGFCVVGTKVCQAGAGGHADYAGNEAYSLELAADVPTWNILCQPTPKADLILDSAVYADGRPSSSHTYYNLHGDATRNRIFRVGNGSQWGSGNSLDRKLVAFNLATNDWDAAGTWPDAPPSGYACANCQDETTGDLYVTGNGYLRRLNHADMTWTQLAAWPDNSSATYYAASAVDTLRRRVVFFSDVYNAGGGLVYDIAAGTLSKITFSGEISVITAGGYSAWYVPALDKFLLKTSTGGDVYSIDTVTFAITQQATSGGSAISAAANGIFNKFVRVPELGGIFYQPNHASNGWFLATD